MENQFDGFVSRLRPSEAREQLSLAYLQMERCIQVLKGEDVEPVEMLDNGASSDLELFYRCRKAAEELSLLSGSHCGMDGKEEA